MTKIRTFILPLVAVLLLALSLTGPYLAAPPTPVVVEADGLAAPPANVQAQGKTFIDWLVVKHITVQYGGIDMNSALDMQTNIIENIGNADTDFDTSGGLTTAGESTFNGGVDLNGTTIKLDADGDTTIADDTDDIILLTSGAATGTWSIRTGNLAVGDGTPGVTLDGEDAYINGFLEVDGTTYLDGALSVDGNISDGDSAVTVADNLLVDGAADAVQLTVQGNGTQTSAVLVVELSTGGDLFTIDNNGDVLISGTTPVLTIGDAGTEDTAIIFDGAAQDFYLALVDAADDLVIGLGASPGTTGMIYLDENQDVGIGGASAGSKLDVTGNAMIDGAADEIQLLVQAHSTQNANVLEVETSAAADLFTVSNTGVGTLAGLANLNGGIAVDASAFTVADATGNMVVGGTSDLKGNVSSSTGVVTITDNVLVDGQADAIQLTVQGHSTQNQNLVVFENSAGTDVFYVTGAGVGYFLSNVTVDGTLTVAGKLTVNDAVDVSGDSDEIQLLVSAYLTQSNNLVVFENYTGTDYLYLTGAGVLQQVGAATVGGLLTVNDAVAITGDSDEVQLTISAYLTQTNDLVLLENYTGTNLLRVTGGGALEITSTVDVTGAVTFNSTLDVDGNVSSGTGAFTVNDDLYATGALNFDLYHAEKTAPYTPTVAESGGWFSNMGASSVVTFTLPAAASGLNYCFYVAVTDGITITPGSGDYIFNLTNAVDDRVAGVTATLSLCLMAIDDEYWLPISIYGAWADIDH